MKGIRTEVNGTTSVSHNGFNPCSDPLPFHIKLIQPSNNIFRLVAILGKNRREDDTLASVTTDVPEMIIYTYCLLRLPYIVQTSPGAIRPAGLSGLPDGMN